MLCSLFVPFPSPSSSSPLSAALLVFGIHKWGQRGAAHAWWEAKTTVYNTGGDGTPPPPAQQAAENRHTRTDSTCGRGEGLSGVNGLPRVSSSTPSARVSSHLGRFFSSAASRVRVRVVPLTGLAIGVGSAAACRNSVTSIQRSSNSSGTDGHSRGISSTAAATRSISLPHCAGIWARSCAAVTARAVCARALPVSPAAGSVASEVRIVHSNSRHAAPRTRRRVSVLQCSATAGVCAVAVGTSVADPSAVVAASLPSASPPASSLTLADVYGADDVPLVLDHLSQWWSVLQMQDLMSWLHSTVGLPWWASIAAATIVLRVIAMPFEVAMLRNSLRMKQIMPSVQRLQEQMIRAASPEEKRAHAQELLQLFRDKQCSPVHGLYIPMLFPPVFLSLFGATHNLALAEPTMITGGALWFVDLVLPDPTWMLPVASSLTWLTLLERTAGYMYLSHEDWRSLARTLAIAFIPVVANMPAGVFCFWITANLFSLGRVMVLNQDAVRSDNTHKRSDQRNSRRPLVLSLSCVALLCVCCLGVVCASLFAARLLPSRMSLRVPLPNN